MNGKLSNASLVVVLLVAFSLFVAGLTASTDGGQSVRGGPATPTPTRTPTPVQYGNFVWRDLNGNKIQDQGEPGVQGITMQLWNSAKTVLLTSSVTSATGNYTLTFTGSGNFYVRAILPSGLTMVTKDQGVDDIADSDGNSDGFTDVIAVASNVISITSIDFGVRSLYPAYVALTPARLADTRASGITVDGVVQAVGAVAAGDTLTVPIGGRGGVPASSIAAALNITAVSPAGSGFLTVYPCDVARPNASSLNTAGATIANEVVARLSQSGFVCIYSSVATHIIVDVVGAYPR